MVEIGDRYNLMPTHAGSDEKEEKRLPGTVVGIYPHGFALVDFGCFRECYPLSQLEGAPRASKKRR